MKYNFFMDLSIYGGRVVRALDCSGECHGFETHFDQRLENSVYSAVNGYLINLREGKKQQKERTRPAFQMLYPKHDGTLTPPCHNNRYGNLYLFYQNVNSGCAFQHG